jgi:hypothetical protein
VPRTSGWFNGSHRFPNQELAARSTRSDIFLTRLDRETGDPVWGSGLIATDRAAASHIPAGLTIDGAGDPWIGGQIFTTTELAQPGQPSVQLSPSYSGTIAPASNDGFVARYARDTGWLR